MFLSSPGVCSSFASSWLFSAVVSPKTRERRTSASSSLRPSAPPTTSARTRTSRSSIWTPPRSKLVFLLVELGRERVMRLSADGGPRVRAPPSIDLPSAPSPVPTAVSSSGVGAGARDRRPRSLPRRARRKPRQDSQSGQEDKMWPRSGVVAACRPPAALRKGRVGPLWAPPALVLRAWSRCGAYWSSRSRYPTPPGP